VGDYDFIVRFLLFIEHLRRLAVRLKRSLYKQLLVVRRNAS
jgi:hypothetical protein